MAKPARPIDGAEGYAFYRRHNGEVELDEINEYLRGLGMRDVRPRMLLHYRKMDRYGYASYVTQNRLDLAIAGDTGWVEEIQSRYSEVAQPVPAELLTENQIVPVVVEGLGLATATAVGHGVPRAGTPVVLRLTASGIERTAVVVRSDSESGRAHLRFDLYTSVAAAPKNAAFAAEIEVSLASESETMAAVSDALLRLERVVAQTQLEPNELVRVTRVSMASPLTVAIQSSQSLAPIVGILTAVVLARKYWYEGTKSDLESQGIRLDNAAKVRMAQLRADGELGAAVDRASMNEQEGSDPDQADVDIVNNLREGGGDAAYQQLSRRQFFAAVRSALLLPIGVTARELDV